MGNENDPYRHEHSEGAGEGRAIPRSWLEDSPHGNVRCLDDPKGGQVKLPNVKSIPVICSSSFNWKGNHGTTEQSKLIEVGKAIVHQGWNGVSIQSAKTGKILYFNPVEDPSENGYDGEFMIYSCNDQYFVQIWNY